MPDRNPTTVVLTGSTRLMYILQIYNALFNLCCYNISCILLIGRMKSDMDFKSMILVYLQYVSFLSYGTSVA